jgi:hypothetical protein
LHHTCRNLRIGRQLVGLATNPAIPARRMMRLKSPDGEFFHAKWPMAGAFPQL